MYGFFALIIVSIILGITSIVMVCRGVNAVRQDEHKQKTLNGIAAGLKLLTIPFFLINLLVWMMFTASFIVIPGFQILLPLVLAAVAFAYFVLLVTSAFFIGQIYIQFRNGRLSFGKSVMHVIFQLIFVIDIIDGIYLFFAVRKICNSMPQQKP